MSSTITKIPILGDETIHIGHNLQSHIATEILKNIRSSTYVIISDDNIEKFNHVRALQTEFRAVAREINPEARILKYIIAPGEESKSRTTKAEIEDWLLAQGCTRDTVILAVGGGVIGDMIGYVAATFMRGVKFVQIPTTLLSMVDSSIGGKTAIDTPLGKNLIGAFWQPERIFIDMAFLETLPHREFINGMAEVIKTAAIWNADEFARLEANNKIFMDTIQQRDPQTQRVDLKPIMDIVINIVTGSVAVKAEVVTKDEREGGLRNLLNFGHSIGHAYEAILTPQILHGECVSVGMVLEAELARYLGILSPVAVARLTKCLAAYELPTTLTDKTIRKRSHDRACPVDDVIRIMGVDKKNDGSKKKIVLLSEIGNTYEKKASIVSDEDIRVILSENIIIGDFSSSPSTVTVTPPGSKSISNRALILASLGKGECKIKNLLHSDDTEHMLNAVKLLEGADVTTEDKGETIVVNGHGGRFTAPEKEIYLGNAGTASRFLATVATLVQQSSYDHVVLTGNSRMKERPIGPLVDALRANGSAIDYKEADGSLPLKVLSSKGLQGGRIELAATISSQYVSSILMCAPYAQNPVTLSLVGGKPISQFYIDMTISMMESFGIKVEKSATEEHTYHIPQGTYGNPSEYVVESDASSATYPLAFAAISGTTCTVPNIGSTSLQGDAKFAVDVLKPMGCTVVQTETSTTVTGPSIGDLKPLTVDMEPMTDAFLTASVLAAVADGPETVITGIANQRVKECNRIDAMDCELNKFGAVITQLPDGLKIQGKKLETVVGPNTSIHTYDDHRVAMSISLLAAAIKEPVLIKDRRCVEKTWPGWWDVLRQSFKVPLQGHSDTTNKTKPGNSSKNTVVSTTPNNDNTIYIIGMRGSGKTSLGKWVASSLGMEFVDLDALLEKTYAQSVQSVVKNLGWEKFREYEMAVLENFMNDHPTGYVASCGGGIVETDKARNSFKKYMDNGGMVLHLHRDIENIISYLSVDQNRPSYVDDISAVWARREQWYYDCSNAYFYSTHYTSDTDSVKVRNSLERFLDVATGSQPAVVPTELPSYFLSLTYQDLKTLENFDEILEGVNAIELRVDMLKERGQIGAIPSCKFVTEQVSYLRMHTDLPIIYTVRTEAQGGKFPDDNIADMATLLRLAFKLGIDIVDMELSLPSEVREKLLSKKGFTQIIGSNHDVSGKLKWNDLTWEDLYKTAAEQADYVKFVGFASSLQDNLKLEEFRKSHTSKPLIAINMGYEGQLSRVLNKFLTPVTHPSLPSKAAPGQLSLKEINLARHTIGDLKQQEFFIAGCPVSQSPSPDLHNNLFKTLGMPHTYSRLETDDAKVLAAKIKELGRDFGGASVTIPLKVDIIQHLDDLSPTAAAIGAVNTVIVNKNALNNHPTLIGENTDWVGIYTAYLEKGVVKVPNNDNAALIVGAGGTARAAVYALRELGFQTIYVLNRTPAKAEELVSAFPAEFGVIALKGVNDVDSAKGPLLVMSCIPANKEIDSDLLKNINELLAKPLDGEAPYRRTLLDAAYKPEVTPIMKLAEKDFGWSVIPGRKMLLHQGLEQFQLWTGAVAPLHIGERILKDNQ